MRLLQNFFAAALTVTSILWITTMNFFPEYTFGLSGVIFTEQYASALLFIGMVIVFLTVGIDGVSRLTPADTAPDNGNIIYSKVPAYDLILAVLSFVVGCYVTIFFADISQSITKLNPFNLFIAAIVILLVIDGVRRTSGLGITIVVIAFFIIALTGHMLPGELAGRRLSIERYSYYLVWDASAILGLASQIIATTVVAFVLFGTLLFVSGGGKFFTDISMVLMGRYRGGQGKIAVLASSLFGSISGNVVGNVVTTGVLTIPMMKAAGFKPKTAGAIEAVASTGGQLLPPMMGIAAFIMAEFLQVQYAEVALAALLPAILFYIAIFIQVDLDAVRFNLRGLPRSEIPSMKRVITEGWYYVIPFVVLIYSLFVWRYPPESAGMLACAVLIAISAILGRGEHRMTLRKLQASLIETGNSMAPMVLIGAAAGIVIATLNITGIGFGLSLALVDIAQGNLLALLILVAAASIVLGMGLPTVGVYVLLATLVAPALVELGVGLMQAHLFILYFGCLSMITPPVAIGAFAAANIAKASPMATGWESVRIGWMIFVIPFLFVSSDTLLLRGPLWLCMMDFGAAVLGIWLVSSGMAGVFFGRGRMPIRILCFIAGACLILPANSIPYSRWLNIAGFTLAVMMVGIALLRQRRHTAVGEVEAI